MFVETLSQLIEPYDPQRYYTGFYEDYEFQKARSFGTYTRLICTMLAVISTITSILTVPVIISSVDMNKMYKRVIVYHITLSSVSSLIFPITGLDVISNYRLVIMDPWYHLPLLAALTAGFTIYAYMAVVVLCILSFLLNFVVSTNFKLTFIPYLRNFDTMNLVRFGAILYGSGTTILTILMAVGSLQYDQVHIIQSSIAFDNRLKTIFLEKNIHTIVLPYGLYIYSKTLAAVMILCIPTGTVIITINYILIFHQRQKYSNLVFKQQKLIIRLEILYFSMLFLCYVPSFATIMFSVFFGQFPEVFKRFPVFLLICVPLQLLPIIDCLLHVLAIRAYRETAVKVWKTILL